MLDHPNVKQYVDDQIGHLRELRDGDNKQLDLQAKEYERRLTELNHAHARAEEDKRQFVTMSVYNVAHRELASLIEVQRAAIEKVTNIAENNARDVARLTNTLTWITRTIVGAILVAIVAFLLRGIPVFPGVN